MLLIRKTSDKNFSFSFQGVLTSKEHLLISSLKLLVETKK